MQVEAGLEGRVCTGNTQGAGGPRAGEGRWDPLGACGGAALHAQ